MKYKEIFKKWHFWVIAISYPVFLLLKDLNSEAYLVGLSIRFFNLDYVSLISYFIIRFLIVLVIYSVIWLTFGRDKKGLLT